MSVKLMGDRPRSDRLVRAFKMAFLLVVVCSGAWFASFDSGPALAAAGDETSGLTVKLVETYESISVYASFTGDANGNNQSLLEYRQAGTSRWIQGMAMTADRRGIICGTNTCFDGDNQWRASVLMVSPATTYEVRVTLTDVDGVSGSPVVTTVTTWKETDQIPSVGRSLYVAPGGSDSSGDGSEGSPYATIQRAADEVLPGDTVFVKAGTYALADDINLTRSGDPDNYITFRNFGSDTVVIDIAYRNRCGGTYPHGVCVRGHRQLPPHQGLRHRQHRRPVEQERDQGLRVGARHHHRGHVHRGEGVPVPWHKGEELVHLARRGPAEENHDPADDDGHLRDRNMPGRSPDDRAGHRRRVWRRPVRLQGQPYRVLWDDPSEQTRQRLLRGSSQLRARGGLLGHRHPRQPVHQRHRRRGLPGRRKRQRQSVGQPLQRDDDRDKHRARVGRARLHLPQRHRGAAPALVDLQLQHVQDRRGRHGKRLHLPQHHVHGGSVHEPGGERVPEDGRAEPRGGAEVEEHICIEQHLRDQRSGGIGRGREAHNGLQPVVRPRHRELVPVPGQVGWRQVLRLRLVQGRYRPGAERGMGSGDLHRSSQRRLSPGRWEPRHRPGRAYPWVQRPRLGVAVPGCRTGHRCVRGAGPGPQRATVQVQPVAERRAAGRDDSGNPGSHHEQAVGVPIFDDARRSVRLDDLDLPEHRDDRPLVGRRWTGRRWQLCLLRALQGGNGEPRRLRHQLLCQGARHDASGHHQPGRHARLPSPPR